MNENLEFENQLDVKDMRLLECLYTTRSVTRTAELMGQSQPNVSTWLRRVRERIGDSLFVRTSGGMTATPRAEILVARIREILEAIHQLTDVAPGFDPGTSTRLFRLCMPDSAQITLLPRMLQHIRDCAPHVQVEALPVDKLTAGLLESGEADLAYGGFVPGMEKHFYQQALFEQDFVCLLNRKHPRIKGDMTIDDYRREAHVSVSYGGVNEVIDAAMKRQRVQRRVLVFLQGFLGVPKIIATTDMITTLPRQIGTTLAKSGALRLVDCPVPMPTYMVRQYWHIRFHHEPGNQWLRAICAEQAVF